MNRTAAVRFNWTNSFAIGGIELYRNEKRWPGGWGNLALGLLWILGTTAASFLGWLIVAVSMIFSLGASLIASGIVLGYFSGWFQEYIIRKSFVTLEDQRWALRSMIGMGLATIVASVLYLGMSILDGLVFPHLFASNPWYALPITGVGGLIIGLLQIRSISSKVRKGWWLVINIVGWPIAIFLAIVLTNAVISYPSGSTLISFPHALYFLVAGTISFCIFSILTAPFIISIILPIGGTKLGRYADRKPTSEN